MQPRPSQIWWLWLMLLPALVLALCYFLTAPGQAPIYLAQSASEPGGALPGPPWQAASPTPRFVIFRVTAPLSATLLQEYDGGVGQGYHLNLFRRMPDACCSIGLHASRSARALMEPAHGWSLCLFFRVAVMSDLRLLGWTMRSVPVSGLSRRLLPWGAAAFVLLSLRGTLLFSAIRL